LARKNINPEKLTGPQKAAIFLLAMGEEFTTSFFQNLDEKSIKEIGRYMSEINYISSDVLNVVMHDFLENFDDELNMAVSGRDFLEDIISKTLDEDTAREIFRVIGKEGEAAPFSELEYVPSETIVNIINEEHPQTIALVLSYIPQEKAAQILCLLPEEIKAEVAMRIVQIGHVKDDLIRELDEAIKNDLSKIGVATRKFDGVDTLANILNDVDGKTEEYVLTRIEEEDGELAEQIRQKMFVFEDLIEVDNRGFREILQNVDNQVLVKALKTAPEEMKEKMLKNLSERAAEMLREDMEVLGPIRLKEVEEAQQTIIRVAKKLEEEGKIVIGGKEEVFV